MASPLYVSALGIVLFLHLASLWYVETLAPSMDGAGGIVDAGFLALPESRRGFGEVIPYLLLAALAASLGYRPAEAAEEAGSAFVNQAAFLMAARAACAAATVLPASYEGCRAGALAVLHGGCRDKVFSGHAAYSALMALHVHEGVLTYERRSRWVSLVVLASAVTFECLYLVAAREHYSVDVLVALFFALLVYYAHSASRLARMYPGGELPLPQ